MVLSEFNCTIPGLELIADEYKVKMVCLDDVAKNQMQSLLSLIEII